MLARVRKVELNDANDAIGVSRDKYLGCYSMFWVQSQNSNYPNYLESVVIMGMVDGLNKDHYLNFWLWYLDTAAIPSAWASVPE